MPHPVAEEAAAVLAAAKAAAALGLSKGCRKSAP